MILGHTRREPFHGQLHATTVATLALDIELIVAKRIRDSERDH